MKRKNLFTLLILIYVSVCVIGCSDDKAVSGIGLYDISNDDKQILFTWCHNGGASILQIDTNGVLLKSIIPATIDTNYFNPKYDRGGTRVLFIGSPKNNPFNCSIYIANVDGTEKKNIVYEQGLIGEAVFSECEDKIYYIKSKEFGHSSPVGRSQPHESDIYSVNLKDGKIERITNMNAYSLYRISEYDCNSMIMDLPPSDGMVKFFKNDPSHLINITPLNNPRQDSTLYDSPIYSRRYNILAFLAPYELYIMNMDRKQAQSVARDENMISNIRLFNNQKRIVYTNEVDNDFFFINFDGSGSKRVSVPIKTD